MSWSTQQLFRYCERGADPAFWGEPINALTNGAFILAAVAAAVSLLRRQDQRAGAVDTLAIAAMIALVFVIGVGSFLFHTTATRWAALADTVPIGVFMLAYMAYALRVFLKLGWIWVALGLALFIAALQYASGLQCRPGLISGAAAVSGRCLNGTAGYIPAFMAMIGIGTVLRIQDHPAANSLLAAGMIFLASMFFRTIDFEVCGLTRLGGQEVGTHFLWHVLNALTLYLLLRAAVFYGQRRAT